MVMSLEMVTVHTTVSVVVVGHIAVHITVSLEMVVDHMTVSLGQGQGWGVVCGAHRSVLGGKGAHLSALDGGGKHLSVPWGGGGAHHCVPGAGGCGAHHSVLGVGMYSITSYLLSLNAPCIN